ncbi:uncharacterized protein ASPGLDRAFT_45194 [Aspergillus glaucus CBS 516.65]|uniref:Uncharacterized protein n=1 Tax=Aspergillus glaucus CBS 516.65 TaxID=1160497 RepID=A0A1L9VQG8_ASPGL|nr:hypothetical protein ASPGLDRAFT_45194 [Aspergillus glaucus CBS 516.65]OJJ86157.1 hypothetical protein ASPGLDRAFT_45194 [Aspergillus glaucus CBS 516.65]
MLLQLLQKNGNINLDDINAGWDAPSPSMVIKLLRAGHSKEKTVVIVIDNLHKIAEVQGRNRMSMTIWSLRNLLFESQGFTLVCFISAISDPLDQSFFGSLMIALPCNPPEFTRRLKEGANTEADDIFGKTDAMSYWQSER